MGGVSVSIPIVDLNKWTKSEIVKIIFIGLINLLVIFILIKSLMKILLSKLFSAQTLKPEKEVVIKKVENTEKINILEDQITEHLKEIQRLKLLTGAKENEVNIHKQENQKLKSDINDLTGKLSKVNVDSREKRFWYLSGIRSRLLCGP